MASASWLIWGCVLLGGVSYAAWVLDRVPRMRMLLAILGVASLAGAVWLHGEFFAQSAPAVATGPATFGR